MTIAQERAGHDTAIEERAQLNLTLRDLLLGFLNQKGNKCADLVKGQDDYLGKAKGLEYYNVSQGEVWREVPVQSVAPGFRWGGTLRQFFDSPFTENEAMVLAAGTDYRSIVLLGDPFFKGSDKNKADTAFHEYAHILFRNNDLQLAKDVFGIGDFGNDNNKASKAVSGFIAGGCKK